ncbi:putative glycosyl hydrolases family 28 [Lyophyllum shimeji]|uniref:Glycosyl hydrolases family 28 n=1 Tax=Lyophyllum shimeji TaxID=47721 RepID=A0A9P3PGF6_LYOSH|nr:putative glycosyl hydrolases family 28 [Lyophyllum shimeji]
MRAVGQVLTTFLCAAYATGTIIQSYNPVPIYTESGYFSLQANGVRVPVHAFDGYAYAHFSFGDGPVTLNITSKQQTSISSFSISPTRLGLDKTAVISANSISVTLAKPEYLIIHSSGVEELILAADPLETNVPPSSGTGIFNVVSQYGADASGTKSSTTAFQNAIRAAGARGQGSIVYVPPGVYPVGNLVLPSDVSLYLAPSSSLRFTANSSEYTTDWKKTSQNLNGTEWIRTAPGSRNIKIFGRGTIDANGKYAQQTGKFIAHAVVPLNTTNFVFDGPVIRDGGSWTLVPTRSSYVTINHAKVFNRMNLGENDAVDVQESQHVVVKNTVAISLDDPFSTKTWDATTDIAVSYPGVPQPIYDVTFSNCLAWTHCYGFKVGQGTLQEQAKIRFEDSTVYDAAVGLGVHHKWGYATAEDIQFKNMAVEKLHGNNDGHQTWLAVFVQEGHPGEIGTISRVNVENVRVLTRGTTAALVQGVDGALVSNVELRDVWFQDLERVATTLAEMSITQTNFSSNVVVKG